MATLVTIEIHTYWLILSIPESTTLVFTRINKLDSVIDNITQCRVAWEIHQLQTTTVTVTYNKGSSNRRGHK